MKHRIEICKNGEYSKLAYMAPVNEDGEIDSGYRIAGPKGWGGTSTIATIDISEENLIKYIKEYAPNVLKELRSRKKKTV